MAHPELLAGALCLVLQHEETGCPHAARQASRLLEYLADVPELDRETRLLCDRASRRLDFSERNSHVPRSA